MPKDERPEGPNKEAVLKELQVCPAMCLTPRHARFPRFFFFAREHSLPLLHPVAARASARISMALSRKLSLSPPPGLALAAQVHTHGVCKRILYTHTPDA